MAEPAPNAARSVAGRLADGGAEAVVLVGSYARGEASPESDVDLLAIGREGYDCRLEVEGGLLASVSVQPFAEFRSDLANPPRVCTAVPGWRTAVVLEDPRGLARALIEEARAWRWEPLEQRCDDWVAEEVCGYAEEVHKLVAALKNRRALFAAVQRSLLATRLATVMAVHRRILYGSENLLWDLVSREMGEGWSVAQSAALGLGGERAREGSLVALGLYGMAAAETFRLLDDRQRPVVKKALELAQSASL